jgi:hypothetical protein
MTGYRRFSERIGKSRLLCRLFEQVWHRPLGRDLVVQVTGWRSCLADSQSGQRWRYTICLFPWD